MKFSRLDLDGAGSPEALVARILKLEPGLGLPIPVEELCSGLDIIRIGDLDTDGFEAALLSDEVKSRGAILVARGRSRQRRRFSIAHELGHFLIPTHMPPTDGQFLCSADQLRLLPQKDQDRRARMEAEANRFAALLLMPPPLLRARLRLARRPRLEQLVDMAETFDVSRDAMARAYTEHHDEPVAVLICQHGKVLRTYRSSSMPWLAVRAGGRVSRRSSDSGAALEIGSITEPVEADPDDWFEGHAARKVAGLTEQTLIQRDGFTMRLLHTELQDPDETDIEDRWRPRF